MNKNERVKTALEHQKPDRIPVALGVTIVDCLTENAAKDYLRFKNQPDEDLPYTHFTMGAVETPECIRTGLDGEFASLRMGRPDLDRSIQNDDGSFYDETGALLVPVSFYYDCIKRPLEGDITLKDIENAEWGDPYDPGRVRGLRERAQKLRSDDNLAIVADICWPGPFEMALWVRGWSDFLADLACNSPLAEALLDKCTEYGIQCWDAFLNEIGDVDITCHGDDLGMQDRCILSPEMYRKCLQKHHKKVYGFIKSRTSAKIFHHSCGSIYQLLPDLIETGVDILNSVQITAKDMEPKRLKREFGKRISFWGGIDVQRLLPSGTPMQVDETIKMLTESFGEDGGFIMAPSHNIQAGTPAENIDAMINAMIKYR
jgi:uroporphyrinogen decarboxylase